MNPMQAFHTAISSGVQPQGSYQEALAELTRLNQQQAHTLLSDLGWQDWGERAPAATDPA